MVTLENSQICPLFDHLSAWLRVQEDTGWEWEEKMAQQISRTWCISPPITRISPPMKIVLIDLSFQRAIFKTITSSDLIYTCWLLFTCYSTLAFSYIYIQLCGRLPGNDLPGRHSRRTSLDRGGGSRLQPW